jgi:hypothetical protein
MFIPPSVRTTLGDDDFLNIALYRKDTDQQVVNTTMQHGHTQNRGAVLIDDNEKIPLPFLIWINDNRTEISRPVTNVLFRDIHSTGEAKTTSPEEFYEILRNNLPNELKSKLEDEETLFFTKRDPDLIALNSSLKFAATLLATLENLGAPPFSSERAKAEATNLETMPEEVKTNITSFGNQVNNELENYLKDIGPNHPSFDMFLSAYNQINDALDLLGSIKK